jgi:hypothetical protein
MSERRSFFDSTREIVKVTTLATSLLSVVSPNLADAQERSAQVSERGPWTGDIDVDTSRGCFSVRVATGTVTHESGEVDGAALVLGVKIRDRLVDVESLYRIQTARELLQEIEESVANSEDSIYENRSLDTCPPPLIS